MTARYVCSSCGGTNVVTNGARPSLDDRYAVGWCETCTPVPVLDPKTQRTRPLVRSTVPLVRQDIWDPSMLAARREKKRQEKLIRDLMAGKLKDGTPSLDEARGLLARFEADAAARRRA